MNSSEQKCLEFSVQAYRQLVRVYPKGFLSHFGDPLLQSFTDLARRALHAGGIPRLLVLWMRILPDLGISAAREHLNASAWLCPSHIRLRWIAACMFGLGIGSLVGDQLGALAGTFAGQARSIGMLLVLGLLQSAWALKRPAGDVFRWTVATTAGCFILALPFRIIVHGFPSNRLSVENEIIFSVLWSAGIGLLQFLMLPKAAFKAWRWIPTTVVGIAGSWLAGVVLVYSTNSLLLQYRLSGFIGGAVLGCLTCIPLESILGPKDAGGIEGAIES